jgi:hypothetical protein
VGKWNLVCLLSSVVTAIASSCLLSKCCCYGRYSTFCVLLGIDESGLLKFREGTFLVELVRNNGLVLEVSSCSVPI